MSNESLITIINNAARPFKSFTVKIGETDFNFKTRTLSAIESDTLNKIFNQRFDEVSHEMEQGNVDVAIIKRGLQRQSKEALAKIIVKADKIEYLSEASTELDDLPFSDERVQTLSEEKQAIAYNLLMGATEEEVLEQALERRAFVTATIKATDAQNLYFLYLCLFDEDENLCFQSADEIGEMDRETIGLLINEIYSTLRGSSSPDPLKPRAKKGSAKRSTSQKTLAEV